MFPNKNNAIDGWMAGWMDAPINGERGRWNLPPPHDIQKTSHHNQPHTHFIIFIVLL